MRTTIRLDEDLLTEAKKAAIERGKTLNGVISDALRADLKRGEEAVAEEPFRVTTFRGELRPGVDLDNSAELVDRMEGTL